MKNKFAPSALAVSLIAAFFQAQRGIAAEPVNPPALRAALYHAEVRSILEHYYHWQVTDDRTGKLTAIRRAYSSAPMMNPTIGEPAPYVACLTITFQPKSVTHTHCAANLVANSYTRDNHGAYYLNSTMPMNSPANTKEIQDTMVLAEKRLVKKHPEYSTQKPVS